MEDTQYIALLINKYLNEELTAEESSLLMEWVSDSPENRLYFEKVQSGDAIIPDLILYDELWGAEGNERQERMIGKVKSSAFPAVTAPPVTRKFYRLWKYVAAASILFVTLGLYFYFNSNRHPSNDPVVFQYDVPAASEQATLSVQGKAVQLDSLTGQLAIGKRLVNKGGGSVVYSNKDTAGIAPEQNLLQTPRGGQYALVLADGTRAFLNSGSSISFPSFFKGTARKVVVSGEVFFTVAKSFDRTGNRIPFIIDVDGRQTIEVKGTEFDINAYRPVILTTVAEGRVLVTSGNAGQVILNKGQQSISNGSTLRVNNSPDLESIFAWRNGNFYFDAAPITEIMEQVKNWYNVEVEYRSKPAGTFTVFTLSRKVPLSELLAMLAKTKEVRFIIEGNAAKNEQVKIIVETPQKHK